MPLLARRALQERFASKHQEGAGGEGIEVGTTVCVLGGRNFPLFTAGDRGEVTRVDQEALNCEVLFEGTTQPVPVALRHLKAVSRNGAQRRPGSCSVSSRSPSRRTSPPSLRGGRELQATKAAEADGGSVATPLIGCAQRSVEEAAPAGTACSNGAPAPNHFGCARSPSVPGQFLADSSMIMMVAGNETPDSRRQERLSSPQDKQWLALGRLERRLAACEVALDVREEPGHSAGDTTDGASFACDGCLDTTGFAPAPMPTSSDATWPRRFEAFEARIEALEGRHRAELAALRGKLEEALAYGRQQEARAQALERQLLGPRVLGVSEGGSCVATHPAEVAAPPVPVAATVLPQCPSGSSLNAPSGRGDTAGGYSCGGSLRRLPGVAYASMTSSGALSARLHSVPDLSASASQQAAGLQGTQATARGSSLGASVRPGRPIGITSSCSAVAPAGPAVAPRFVTEVANSVSATCGSAQRALSASASPGLSAVRRQSSAPGLTPGPRPALFLVARPGGCSSTAVGSAAATAAVGSAAAPAVVAPRQPSPMQGRGPVPAPCAA
eukprot:CAMPEP_0180726514 /NCGR_PEP_ID=MMETSP1038_2-20121128/18597_1 /TAXON_ID=632150 /ORGANISM="Azadinium spinosum, Strain 3D9" /LENGTH=556 /DNA_ID=CAMNT_0022759153 /DNA_START=9 /DNA_END=1679 /DNA_ORIENTATION=+